MNLVEACRATSHTGDHDPAFARAREQRGGPRHLAGLVHVLAAAGHTTDFADGSNLVDLAKKSGAWTDAKAGEMPSAGHVVVAGLATALERAFVVVSVSPHHLESFGSAPDSLEGGLLVEHRSRQWATVQPRNEDGTKAGPAYILDSAHHGIPARAEAPAKVAGWFDPAKLVKPPATAGKKADA